jgi:hypothetical protein
MGAKAWMLVFTDLEEPLLLSKYGEMDRASSENLAKLAFPMCRLTGQEDLTIMDVCPPDDEILTGRYDHVSILSASEFGLDYPSKLDKDFVNLMKSKRTYLFAMHSVVDFFAFGVWENGELRRSFGASPDSGILEDVGEKFDFELPYFNGEHAVGDEDDDPDNAYPLPFHPLEFGEHVLRELVGYGFEGPMPTDGLDPFDFSLLSFSRKKKMGFG